jgi:putative membrane protein
MTAARNPEGWRRLSNRMLVVHPIQELLRAWPVLIGLIFAGSANGHGSWWSLVGAVIVVGAGILRWVTTTYRVTAEQVQVRKGLFRRQVLTIPRDRVRSVDVTANLLHRALGLARVKVGTGRSDRKDDGLRLDALDALEATRLRDELLHRAPARAAAPDDAPATAGRSTRTSVIAAQRRETVLATVAPSWVRYGPFSLTGLVAVGVLGGVMSRLFNEARVDPGSFGPLSDVLDRWEHASLPIEVASAGLVLLITVGFASTIGYVLTFYGFRLTRSGSGTLHVTRGLVTTRAVTIEERRLRGVELSEPLLLRLARGARCLAITTGLRVGHGAERGGSLLLPPAPRGEAERVAVAVLGRDAPVTCALTAHGRWATRRRYARAVGCAVAIVGGCLTLWGIGVLPAWAWRLSLVLLPAAALLARDRSRSLGHALVEETFVSRWGSLVRRRAALSCAGIIGWNIRQSFFQRRSGLATLVATTAAGRQRVDVQDLPLADALRLADEALPGLLEPFRVR